MGFLKTQRDKPTKKTTGPVRRPVTKMRRIDPTTSATATVSTNSLVGLSSPAALGVQQSRAAAAAMAHASPMQSSMPWWISDVTFVVEGMPIQAHKVVLSSRSRYFSRLFATSTEPQYCVTEFSAQAFGHFIRWLYATPKDLEPQIVMELLQCARYYEVPDLQEFCEATLASLQTPSPPAEPMFTMPSAESAVALTNWSTDPVLYKMEANMSAPSSAPVSAGGPFSEMQFGGGSNTSLPGLSVY